MKTVILGIICIGVSILNAQNLSIEYRIETNDVDKYEGLINNKFPIVMELQSHGTCGFEDMSLRWANRKLIGWYYYKNKKKKIPIIGYANFADSFEEFKERTPHKNYNYKRIELFVPKNLNDTMDSNCQIKEYQEVFIGKQQNFKKLTWTKDGEEFPVELSKLKRSDLKAQASATIKYKGLNLHEINLTELFEKEFINDISIMEIQDLDEVIHITTQFNERSIPGSSGSGYCGSGMEEYIAYIRINKNWEIERTEIKQTHSCLNFDKVENFKIVKGKPEMGLVKNE